MVEASVDGERLARECAEAEQARLDAGKAQAALPQSKSKTHEQSPIRKSKLVKLIAVCEATNIDDPAPAITITILGED